ncbi:MAG: transporter substrate-binding domain-containing protein [Opitutaceae bacterium]|nr:transporter substrate-binding domain-containing protein [Opitutaceae bacterium]
MPPSPARVGGFAGVGRLLRTLALGLVLAPMADVLAQTATAVPQRIRVVLDNNYPPYVLENEAGNPEGILIDQWRAWERKTGIKVELHAMAWGEALRRMRAGEFDVIDTIFETSERRAQFDFTRPYATIEVPIFFRQDISGLTSLASLRGFPVAAKIGDDALDLIAAQGTATILPFASYEAIIEAAKQHQVNVFVVDAPPALYFLNKHGIAGEFRRSPPINLGRLHRAVRKGETALLRRVEAGFAAIGGGELRRIDEKWLGRLVATRPRGGLLLLLAAALLGLAILIGWNRWLRKLATRVTTALHASERRFQAIFERAPLGISEGEIATGQFIRVNRRYAEILGYSVDEIQKLTFKDFTHPEDLPKDLAEFERLAAGGIASFAMEKRYVRKDGAVIWAKLSVSSLAGSGEKPRRCMAIIDDITEEKRAKDEVRQLHTELRVRAAELERRVAERTAELAVERDRAEAADRLKSTFLASMSHELRTPLNSIIGFTGILLQKMAGPINAEQEKQLGLVRTSARHLLDLINDVLDLSKIEAGELRVAREPFDVRASLEKIAGIVQPLAQKKGLALAFSLAPEVGLLVSDRRRVEQVLLNLLTNAVKFTARGSITLTAAHEGDRISVSVTDTGEGIAAHHLPQLFKPFQQVNGGLTRPQEGTGLGLAICRKLLRLLGGEITVVSEPGRGSTFAFFLPLQPDAPPVSAPPFPP